GRAGGGRPLPPNPDHVISAQAKVCPHWGHGGLAAGQSLQAVYDQIEVPPSKPMVTRVELYGGRGAGGGQPYGAPVPGGMEPGPPVGASVQRVAPDLRYPQAIRDERRSALVAQGSGVPRRAGALATLCHGVKARLDPRREELLRRLRSRRVRGRDETSARVHGRNQWAWVCQHDAVGIQVLRPSRGRGVLQEGLGDQRPPGWGSDLYRAQTHHPAEPWPVWLAPQRRAGQVAIAAGDAIVAPRLQAVLRRALTIQKRRAQLAGLHALAGSRCSEAPFGARSGLGADHHAWPALEAA
ncbi:MAG TPA: hypothetical protein VGC99_00400, partial [Candidatus Tectomicrobia bacterium]